MEEETTTEATEDNSGVQTINGIAVNDQSQPIPQLEESEEATAVEKTTDTEQQTESTSEEVVADEPSEDEQLAKFAETKGLTLDSENAKKAAKMAMNAERLMHQKSAKASELEKAAKITDEQVPTDVTPQQADTIRMRNLELKFDIQDWKAANPEKLKYEAEMVQVLSDPTKRSLVQEGYLSLNDVYSIARAGSNVEANLKSQGKQEALESLAQKQQAAVPRGNAVTAGTQTATITPQNVDKLVAQHDHVWFRKNYEAINKAVAGI